MTSSNVCYSDFVLFLCGNGYYIKKGSVAKNLAFLQNQLKPSQFGKLIHFIRKKMTPKGEKYSVKLKKYYFCNGTALTHGNRYFTKR
jgi:hypothetical protein